MKNLPWKLIATLVVLALAAVLVLQREGETSSSGSSGTYVVRYDSSAVDKIEIHAKAGDVTLRKDAGVWTIVSPIHFRADEAAATAAVGKGATLEIKSVVSTNPEKQGLFQVDSTATLVTVFAGDAEKAAFRVGKPGTTWSDTYVRQEGSNDVCLVDGSLASVFGKSVKDWRDKSIFKISREAIRTVKFQYGDTTFTLAFHDSTWMLDDAKATEGNVNTFLNAISSVQTDDFIDTALAVMPPLVAVIEVEGTQLRFHHEKDAAKYIVETSQSQQLYDVQKWRVDSLLKRKKDFVAAGA